MDADQTYKIDAELVCLANFINPKIYFIYSYVCLCISHSPFNWFNTKKKRLFENKNNFSYNNSNAFFLIL